MPWRTQTASRFRAGLLRPSQFPNPMEQQTGKLSAKRAAAGEPQKPREARESTLAATGANGSHTGGIHVRNLLRKGGAYPRVWSHVPEY